MKGFPGPDPETWGDAHNQRHEILDHVDSEVRGHAWGVLKWTRNGQTLTVLANPAPLPVLAEGLFIEVASNNNSGWHRIKDTEDPNAHHETLQFLCLGAPMFHDGTDTEKWYKACQKKWGANEEVDKEGS